MDRSSVLLHNTDYFETYKFLFSHSQRVKNSIHCHLVVDSLLKVAVVVVPQFLKQKGHSFVAKVFLLAKPLEYSRCLLYIKFHQPVRIKVPIERTKLEMQFLWF